MFWLLSAIAACRCARSIRRPTKRRRRHLKNFAATLAVKLLDHAKGKPLEIWFQDEARIGQQGTLTRVWAERGTRPCAPRDQRYKWAYIFGAVCPRTANCEQGTKRISAAIVHGPAPADLTVTDLAKALPYSWAEQEQGIGLIQ